MHVLQLIRSPLRNLNITSDWQRMAVEKCVIRDEFSR